jgi:hypothetical protein
VESWEKTKTRAVGWYNQRFTHGLMSRRSSS